MFSFLVVLQCAYFAALVDFFRPSRLVFLSFRFISASEWNKEELTGQPARTNFSLLLSKIWDLLPESLFNGSAEKTKRYISNIHNWVVAHVKAI